MTNEQICKMLDKHRLLIRSEIKLALYLISQDDNAAELQEQLNNRDWTDFAKWLAEIRDE